MLISIEWLSDFLDLTEIETDDLAERLSRTGLEVESVANMGANLNNLVVGEVVELETLPDSDHLSLTKVNIGSDNLQQIVCGAPNVALNQKVIVALPGAHLPGDFLIEETVLRGVASNGMICSLQELGFSDSVVAKEYAKGIFVLPEDAPIGADVIEYMQLDDDIIEFDLTPNRADALSMYGTAYEVGAILDQKPQFTALTLDSVIESSKIDQVTITVEEPSLSPVYQLRLIENVTVKESPMWLQIRLMKAGIRPINNIVDVTNYYLLLFGQPMHSFDYDALPSKAISIEQAKEGQIFTTLDDVERHLTVDDVVIASGGQPVALAGVMGGLDSEVTQNTRNVLLETALFNPQRVRSTSKRFNLRSESSARFEKGINHATITESGEQAAELIAQLTGGQVASQFVEANSLDVKDVEVNVANDALINKIGIDLTNEEIEQIIQRLGFTVEFHEDYYVVTVPPRRWDITIEADILEEISRIYGYDNIPMTLPVSSSRSGHLTESQKLVRHTRAIAESMGLNQVISYVLTSEERAHLIKSEKYALVKLDLPMSEERTVLRQSLFPALIEIAQYNAARQNNDLAFYEAGRVFYGQGKHHQPIEAERFGILVSGYEHNSTWYANKQKYDFYSIKGMLETYFEALRLTPFITYTENTEMKVMHPRRTANVILDGETIGFFGQIHPKTAEAYDLDHATFYAELDFGALVNFKQEPLVQQPIPRFPSTSRDIAVLVSNEQENQALIDIIQTNGSDYLISVELFDRYIGENIANDKQSLAYHLVFQHPEQTLTDKEVDAIMADIIVGLETVEGLEIR